MTTAITLQKYTIYITMSSTRKRRGNFTYHWFDLVDTAWHQILEKVLKKIWTLNLIYFIWMMNKFGRSQRFRFFCKFSARVWMIESQFQLIFSVWWFLQSAYISMLMSKMDNVACEKSSIAIINADLKGPRLVFNAIFWAPKRLPPISLKTLKVRCANQWSNRLQDFIDTWKRSLVFWSSSKIPSNDWFGFLLSQSKNESFWSD